MYSIMNCKCVLHLSGPLCVKWVPSRSLGKMKAVWWTSALTYRLSPSHTDPLLHLIIQYSVFPQGYSES